MRTRTRMGVAIAGGLVIVIVLVVLFTGSGSVLPNNKPPYSESQTTTSQEPSQSNNFAYIGLVKASEPETFVELTEEELGQFPALKAALQTLEASGKDSIMYKTSEPAATAPMYYLEKKYCGPEYCVWNHIFKYGEHFYSIAVALP